MVMLRLAVLLIAATGAGAEAEFAPKQITTYPFIAAPERAATITNNFSRITPGMTPKEVTAILGEPDEVRSLHDPRIKTEKNNPVIGHTYWYVLRRAKES